VDLRSISDIAGRDGLPYVRLPYDAKTYPFPTLVGQHLGIGDLSQLHTAFYVPVLSEETEQHTDLHVKLYNIGVSFTELYREFVRLWVIPLIGEDVAFQTTPNLRFQTPGSMAVNSWHTDKKHGHGLEEINFWVPLTTVTEHNCVWIESTDGADEIPMPGEVGEVLIFDGPGRRHGNKVNTSDRTRVSFEFRVIPMSHYRDRPDTKSTVMGKRFVIGDYFDSFTHRMSGAR
jgi:hypothetical protein